jgi:hypothetical protein
MSSRLYTISNAVTVTNMGEIIFIRVPCLITWRPSSFLNILVHWLNLDYGTICPRHSNMFCLFIKNLLELFLFQLRPYYWTVFHCDFEEISNKYGIIFSICFHFNRLENGKCNSSSERHLKNPKTSGRSLIDLTEFLSKYLNSNS